MTRRCDLTGKTVQVGNNVSHANNKTRRRFLPNLQHVSVMSEALGTTVRLRLTPNALRTIESNGGLDAYLTSTRANRLSDEMKALKRRVVRAKEARAAKAA